MEKLSVWFNVVIWGDNDLIIIGLEFNVQDGLVLYMDLDILLIFGCGVMVGYKVMLYGCDIGDYSFIGINVVILNGVKIGKYCLIGVNMFILEGMEILDGFMVVGFFGKIKWEFNDNQKKMLEMSVQYYVQNVVCY